MTIDQLDVIDLTAVDEDTDEIWLVISDHLPWDEFEGDHLLLLQKKLNTYLAFVESGEIRRKVRNSIGRTVVIKIVGKFVLSAQGEQFIRLARGAVEDAGLRLEFELKQPN